MRISFSSVVACLVLLLGCSKSNYVVLEKSGKRPAWVNGLENNYFITYGSGNTSEEAKNECLKNIREQIVNAVAITVRSKTDVKIEQKNGITDEKFNYYLTSQSANLPAIQGISLSKATDSYWEKVLDKDKNVKFGYYVKYPFSNAELNNLIADYQAQQEELNKKIKKYIAAVDTFSTVNSLKNTVLQLNNLSQNLIDERKETVEMAKITLQTKISALRMVEVENKLGFVSFVFKVGNKTLKVNESPIFKSECAKLNQISLKDTLVTVSYNYDLCKYSYNPKLTFSYDLGINQQSFDAAIDVNANKVQLQIKEAISITKLSENETDVNSVKIDFSINSIYNNPLKIYRIDLIPDGQQAWKSDSLDIKINQKGIKNINLILLQNVKKIDYSSKNKAFPYLNLVIFYFNVKSGKSGSIKLNNVSYVTNW